MPERPDLEYQVGVLQRELTGLRVDKAGSHSPVALRQAVLGDFSELVSGRVLERIWRRGHFVMFGLSGEPALELAIHPMLAGRFQLVKSGARLTKDTGASFDLSDGRSLRFRDNKQMGKVYLLPAGAYVGIPRLEEIGLDVLDPEVFTFEAFRSVAAKRRDQVKVFLLDKAALDSLGNAYADEVAFRAKLHPKAWVSKLSEAQLVALHAAIRDVVREATDEIARREPRLEDKLRDFLQVRNRKGAPCSVCGAAIRTAGVHGHDAYFCPTCQPDGRGAGFVDWRKAGR